MKIVEAPWELRNLGVTTQEISFDESDIDFTDEIINMLYAQYQVAKVSAGNRVFSAMLQDIGFRFVEDQIKVSHDLHAVKRSISHQRMQDAVDYHLMDSKEISELYDEVDAGLFDSDRISLDPYFGIATSARRYHNWISDLIEGGTIPYVLTYKEKGCAFVVLKDSGEGVYNSILGGYYRNYRNTGLGVVEKEMEIVSKLGGTTIVSHVSSNNQKQLRAMFLNGYSLVEIQHVFVKHIS